ncbi:MAG TPA: 4'-phosphopantetheinyl transferase superfamily protein [Paucimonas sp.]|nr:4'-phosphopantetheinyl transferase superfamily protein [Paucimonas sp.]
MITLTPAAADWPLADRDLHLTYCRYAYDDDGLAGGVLHSAPHPAPAMTPRLPAALERAVPKRQAEYLAGRYCAQASLSAIGLPAPVEINSDRSPRWPPGGVGSISHADGLAVAVAARRERYGAVGIDVERMLDAETAAQIGGMLVVEDEMDLRPAGWSRERFLTLVFSAKEALYKAVYPLCGQIMEFHDARLHAIGDRALTLSLCLRPYPAGVPEGRFCIDYRFEDDMCMTLLAVEAARCPS